MPTFHIEQSRVAPPGRKRRHRAPTFDRVAPPPPPLIDVIVLNTCTVTAAADAQAREAIRKIHAAKPTTPIIVTGCYAQRAPEDLATLPGVSYVVGNSHKPQIPNLISSPIPSSSPNFVPLNPLTNAATLFVVGVQHVAPATSSLHCRSHPTRPNLIGESRQHRSPRRPGPRREGQLLVPPQDPGRLQQPLFVLRHSVRSRRRSFLQKT